MKNRYRNGICFIPRSANGEYRYTVTQIGNILGEVRQCSDGTSFGTTWKFQQEQRNNTWLSVQDLEAIAYLCAEMNM